MHPTVLAMIFDVSHTPAAMCWAGVAVFLIGAWTAKGAVAAARGLDKIAALSNLCFAIPLAVFGALHLSGPQLVLPLVPGYMPWRLFWAYLVGCGLIAASLSIATETAVRWSGVLLGMMMFLFVAMIHLPGALVQRDRILWTIVFREMSFGGAGLVFAGSAMAGLHGSGRSRLVRVGGTFVAAAAVVFGVLHFLHPTVLPGVPLRKLMPAWVPAPMFIDYVTGAALLVAGGTILLARKVRTVTTLVGGWILLLVLVIYGPILVMALMAPGFGARVEAINYFADTLLFAGAILAVASATPRS